MKLQTKELEKAIERVIPGIAQKEIFDQANKLAFANGKLVSYNDEVSISYPLPGSENISGAIDGRRLFELLKKTDTPKPDEPEPEVVLEQKGDAELEIRAGSGGRIKLSLNMAKVVLPFSEVDQTGEYDPLKHAQVFRKALKLVAETCARDMSRPVLTCVHMDGELMAGADGYRVAQFRFAGASLPNMLLPFTAAEVLGDPQYNIEKIAVGTRGEWVRFKTTDGTEIAARLANGLYPDLTNALAIEGTTIVLPKSLDKTLERAQVFSKRGHRIDEEVKITLRGPHVIVNASYEGGRFEETVRAPQEASGEFTIHPDFLSEALEAEGGATCVLGANKIKFTGPAWQHVVALR